MTQPETLAHHEHDSVTLPDFDTQSLDLAAGLFRALGDCERLRLLAVLSHGERCVTELATSVDAGLSTVSQRLRVLRSEGLLSRRREGKHIFYALADDHVAELVANALAHADEQRT